MIEQYLLSNIILIVSLLVFVKSQESCISMCDASYPLHTLDKVSDLQACTKGCRLQYISHLSRTKSDCAEDCTHAYGKSLNEKKACQEGCQEQKALDLKPKMLQVEETSDLTFHFRLLHPIFVARNYYYTLFNKESQSEDGGRRSNSFYFAEQASSDGKGNSIFVRLEMHPLKIGKYRTFDSVENDDMEAETVETHKTENTVNEGSSSSFKHYVKHIHSKASRWLNCVEMKAGVPYTTLMAILFMSLAMVAWVCCSTCEEDDEETDEEEHEVQSAVKRHKFKSPKVGLSIMADKLHLDKGGDVKIFTISSSRKKNDDCDKDDDERLLQI